MKTFLTTIMLLGAAVAAPGQSAAVREVQLVTFAITLPDSPLFYKNGEVVEEFVPNLAGSGGSLGYRGPSRLILHHNEEAFDPEMGGAAEPAAFVDLPRGAERVLLVVAEDAKGKLRMVPYDISRKTMNDGDYRLFNFSTKQVGAVLGTRRIGVKAGGNQVVGDERWQQETLDLRVRLGVADPKSGEVRPVYTRTWGHRPMRRNFVFIFDVADGVGVRKFFDVLLR